MAERDTLEPVGLGLLLEVPAQQAGGMYAPPGQDPGGMDGGGLDMKLLKPGDPCPCCGQPIKKGLPTGTMIFLSWLAEGMTLRTAAKMGEAPDAQ